MIIFSSFYPSFLSFFLSFSQALAHFHEAVRIDPLFADAYSNMGNTYKDLGRLDDAVKCYMTAIQLQPSYADAYANLGSAYKDAATTATARRPTLRPDALRPFVIPGLSIICSGEHARRVREAAALVYSLPQIPVCTAGEDVWGCG